MTYSKKTAFLWCLPFVLATACSSRPVVKTVDVSQLSYGKTSIAEFNSGVGANLRPSIQYKLADDRYTYLVYPTPDYDDTLNFLFKNDYLESIVKQASHKIKYGDCAIYPLPKDYDPNACFGKITSYMLENRIVPGVENVELEKEKEKKYKQDMVGAVVETVVYTAMSGGLILPIAAISYPYIKMNESSNSKVMQQLQVIKLGDRESQHQALLSSFKTVKVSEQGFSKSIQIYNWKSPVYSIGVYNGEIIWLR